jgi:hypothetical protein
MTAKEKAEYLFRRFIKVPDEAMRIDNAAWIDKPLAKWCAINCCNEIIGLINSMPDDISLHYQKYYDEVKSEIEKL